MHDRRIAGETFAFGNAGGLYLGAMTWWDHETQSIWSQPVGEALNGPMVGTRLELLPSQVTTWGNWARQYPTTYVMVNDLDRIGGRRQGFSPNFVIGVVVGDVARAYYYDDVTQGLVNDLLGDFPADFYEVARTE